MSKVVATSDINAQPEAVWNLMCDAERYPELVPATERMVRLPEGTFGQGTTYREYGGVPPFKSESEWRVTEFRPMTYQKHVGDDGSMRMDLEIYVEPTDRGCILTIELEMTPRWYIAPVNAILWPLLMRKRAQAVVAETTQNTKRAAETGNASI